MLEEFKNWLAINGANPKTVTNYFLLMQSYFRQYDTFNQENINAYLASKVNKIQNGSFNMILKALKKYNLFSNTDFVIPKLKKVESKPRKYLTDEFVQEILNKADLIFDDGFKTKLILRLMYETGLRPKELLQLKREDINLEQNIITVKNTKTFKSRIVLFSEKLTELMNSYFIQYPEITNAFNINEGTLTYICKTLNEYLHLPFKITPYTFRHTAAKMILRKSRNDLTLLKRVLGHTNITTTNIYSDIDDNELMEKCKKILN